MPTKRIKRVKKVSRLNAIDRIDSIRLCLDYGIDLQNRTLSLHGPVNEAMYERAVSGLSILNQLQAQDLTIRLSTYGGDLYAALAIYDLIKLNKTPVDILAIGQCMSAGTLIIQAARVRKATENTQLMTHHGHDSVSGTFKDVQRYVHHVAEIEERVELIFAERCGWDAEEYANYNSHDTYWSAREAVRNNIIDVVVTL